MIIIISQKQFHQERFCNQILKLAILQRMELVLCSYVKSTLGDWVSTKNGLAVITR